MLSAGSIKKFLNGVAESLDLPIMELEMKPGRWVSVLTWKGQNPQLKSILLNSHTDVVPVIQEQWHYDPFEAVKDSDGNIYARGAQDMKCVGMQYVEAIRRLKDEGKTFPRTVHLSFVPDEEIGGKMGMAAFVQREEFKALNLGFALDEGLANPEEEMKAYYGERVVCWLKIKCPGNTGHGSRFIENTAAGKLQKIIDSLLGFRESEKAKLERNRMNLGDVTTVNLTLVQGGFQVNVVPSEFTAMFDIRITPSTDIQEFEEQIKTWCKDAGDDVTYEKTISKAHLTSTSPSDPWWKAFSSACVEKGVKLQVEIFMGATDSRYLRQLGYPAIGFSPMNHTPILLHENDEFLNERVFLRGIDIYTAIIPALASVPPLPGEG
uniref:N-acyl-aliphatic-L-amino acid amidohydrolase n=1 Tax=Eptatretus burgeri TaxID=7764 RepID=A0A8C4QQX1_EPTBU